MPPYIIKETATVQAEIPRVWEALTNPGVTKKYFYNCEVISDWKVGSPIVYQEVTADAVTEHVKGVVTAYIDQKLFSYEFKSMRSGELLKVTFELLKDPRGGTEIIVTQDCGNDKAAYDDSSKGWEFVLDGLKFVVED